MLTTLEIELEFAERRNWSFRIDTHDFEYLCPTSMMVATPQRANAQQVFRYHPALRTKAEAHDGALGSLREACRGACDQLIHSAAFSRLPMPDTARPGDREFFAEYVINGVRDLLRHYTFAEFWKTHGGEYLRLRLEPSLAPSFRSLDERGDFFGESVTTLRTGVERLQERLADQAGLPPVDPALT